MNLNYIIINLYNYPLNNIQLINIICYLYSNKFFKTYIFDGQIIYPIILTDKLSFVKDVDQNLVKFLDNLSTLSVIDNIDDIPSLRNEKINKYFIVNMNSEVNNIILNNCYLQFILKKNISNCYVSTNISKINNNKLYPTDKIFKIAILDNLPDIHLLLNNKLNINTVSLNNTLDFIINVEQCIHKITNFSEKIQKHVFTKEYSLIREKYCFSKINLIPNKFSENYFLDLIHMNKPFTIIRYGDGELINIYYSQSKTLSSKTNADNCNYNIDLGNKLLSYLSSGITNNSNFFLLMQYHHFIYDTDFNEIFRNKILSKTNFHINSGFFVNLLLNENANKSKNYTKFIDFINTKNVLYIGPSYAKSEINPIKYNFFIEILQKNCFTQFNYILSLVDKNIKKISCIICQGGFGIKPVIFELYKKYTHLWIFDIGSSIDYYFKRNNRKFLKNL